MEATSVESILCPHCLAPVSATAVVCPSCGASMNAGEPVASGPQPAAPAESAPTGRPRLEDRPWFVLAIVFGAALFLGYPTLWNCPTLSRGTKIVVTVLVAIETVLVFWAFWAVMRWSYQSVANSL